MDAELAKKALKNASLNIKKTKGIILQTDLGSQYTSNIFEEYLAELKIRHSYSRKGCPYDNSCIESFHSILKKEEVNLKNTKISKRLIMPFLNSLKPGITVNEFILV